MLIVAAAAVVLLLNGGSGTKLAGYVNAQVNQTQIAALQSIAMNTTLASSVGSGVVYPYPTPITGKNVTTVGGKPALIFVGADYCPYCALTRWGMIIALMRFGNFQQLHYMLSSPSDVFRNTATFTFYNSSYSSDYIAFLPVEVANRSGAPLGQLDQLQGAAAAAYDTGESVPFIDFGNQSVQVGIPRSITPQTLSGMNWAQIIALLGSPGSTVSQTIIGQANVFTAQICRMDNYTPASVCGQQYVKSIIG